MNRRWKRRTLNTKPKFLTKYIVGYLMGNSWVTKELDTLEQVRNYVEKVQEIQEAVKIEVSYTTLTEIKLSSYTRSE